MPITSIHEEVALLLTKKYKYLDTKDFYLGAYAPDSVNLHGFASKELRWTAHQRRQDLNDWRSALRDFYNQEKNNYPKNFLLGYVTHILTDIIFDDYFYDDIKHKMLEDNIPEEKTHPLMGEDMECYTTNSNYKDKIISVLKNQDTYYDILNITAKDMELFGQKVLNTNYKKDKNTYITEQLLINLSEAVNKELKPYLEDSI